MWTKDNITESNFPETFSLLYTAFEYEKYNEYSYKVAIVDLARVELMYNVGGFYFDLKFEALRPLDPFRKYEIIFNDYDQGNNYREIRFFGGIAGAEPRNYHLNFILNRILSSDMVDWSTHMFIHTTGSFNYIYGFTSEEMFTVPGLGFHLFIPITAPEFKFSAC